MIEYIPELMNTGAISFKIEGRMKSAYYAATVVKAYREAIDAYFENPKEYKFQQKWLENLQKPSHRKYYTGFYLGDKDSQIYESSSYIRNYDIVGIVVEFDKENNLAVIEQRNKVFNNDVVEVLRPVGDNIEITLKDMKDDKGNKIDSAPRAQMLFSVKVDTELQKNDILVKAKEDKN